MVRRAKWTFVLLGLAAVSASAHAAVLAECTRGKNPQASIRACTEIIGSASAAHALTEAEIDRIIAYINSLEPAD
jgi:hypothetical protein